MATIASIIKDGIAAGKNTAEILEMVKAEKPEANTSAACVAYYRSKMKKETKAVTSNDDKMAEIGSAIIAQAQDKAKKAAKPAVSTAQSAAQAELRKMVQQAASVTPTYTVGNIKTFNGMEGSGYNATLYREGTAVAKIIDDASGGPLMIDWCDFKGGANFVEIQGFDYQDKPRTYNGTPEEKILVEYVSTLPNFVVGDTSLRMTDEVFIDELVQEAIMLKKVKALCRNRVVFMTQGREIMSLKCLPSSENIAKVRAQEKPYAIFNTLSNDDDFRTLLKQQVS